MKWHDLKIWSLAALLSVGLAGWSALAWAEPPAAPGPAPEALEEAGPPPFLLETLKLTQDQLDALKQDKFAGRRRMIKWRAEMENLHLDLEAELDSPKPNQAQIEKLARRIGELHGQMIASRAQSVIFLRKLLTPEQLKQLDAMRVNPETRGCPGMGMEKTGLHGQSRRHTDKEKP